MSPAKHRNLDDLLLTALDSEDDPAGHVRGGDEERVGYYLRELPSRDKPAAVAPVRVAPEQRGAASAALVPEMGSGAQARVSGSVEVPSTCANCGALNPATSKFCNACGHPLVAAPSESQLTSGSHRAPATLDVVLVSINEDGSDGPRIELRYNDSVVGRAGDVRFPTDAFLSPKHARINIDSARKVFIEDLYSLNGTYVKLREESRLTPGDTFLMGRQVLRFEKFEHNLTPKARSSDGTRYMGSPPPGGQFKLLQVGIGGVIQNVFCLHESGAIVGREKGDVIFPRDKFMSGRHAQIFPREDGHYYLVDLNSSNGTWIKIWERKQLNSGDFVFLGQQLFRIEF